MTDGDRLTLGQKYGDAHRVAGYTSGTSAPTDHFVAAAAPLRWAASNKSASHSRWQAASYTPLTLPTNS